jgi:ubiquinone/menaquinone biosynthesis C-methylase UbiE
MSTPLDIVTSSDALRARLESNRRYSSVDFQDWLLERLAVAPGMDVLDVGCGTGAQALALLETVGLKGSISALDVSAPSVERVREQARKHPNLEAEVAEMMTLAEVIAARFRVKKYDLAQSTYALYYAADPVRVLDAMRAALRPTGRMAVCVPNNPHGLVEFIRRFMPVPPANDASGRFGGEVLEPYFRRHFIEVDISLLCNVQRIPTTAEVMKFWRNTSYFNADVAGAVEAAIDDEVTRAGAFAYEKNSFLVVGRTPRDG